MHMKFIALVGIASTALSAAAQVPHIVQLRVPENEVAEPFVTVIGIRELSTGHVAVVDSRRNAIVMVDMKSGAARQVGRLGEGAGEYCHPIHIAPLPGDSSLVFDAFNSKLLLLSPTGEPGAQLKPSRLAEDSSAIVRRIGAAVTDTGGTLFVAGASYRRLPDRTIQYPDSIAVERWSRSTWRAETVAFVAPLEKPGIAPMISRPRPAQPFVSREQWSAGSDGRVAIVHLKPYRVDIIETNGRRILGQPLPDTTVTVTEAHRESWFSERPFSGDGGMAPVTRSADGQINPRRCGAPGQQMERPSEIDWGNELPAFPMDAVSFSPDGMLWIRRNTAARQPQTFDVVGRRAELVARVTLPPTTRLVGFGAHSLYAVRVDDAHAQFLQRYALPELANAR
jgi:hypothetical protein